LGNQELEKQCKWIAVFLGVPYEGNFQPFNDCNILLKAVEKIESLGYVVVIAGTACSIRKDSKTANVDVLRITRDTKKWAIFHAVSRFIDKYTSDQL